jgi:methylmalonyl-CoA mutase
MLFSEFNTTTSVAWREKMLRDFKGSKTLADLTWQTPEGFDMQVFYHNDEATAASTIPVPNTSENKWLIHEIIRVSDAKTANQTALEALQGGAESLCFVLDNALTAADFNALLDSVFIEMIHLSFSGQWVWQHADMLWANLKAVIAAREIAAENINITIAADPSNSEAINELLIQVADYQNISIIDLYCNGNTAQQLQQLIKASKTLLSRHAGLRKRMQLHLPIGNSFMLEIAKLRALRLLWQSHIDSESLPIIHAFTAPNTLTESADYNKIMATTQAMSAILGGADKISVTPSDTAQNPASSPFARRIARNVQHLLRLESHLDKVIDPAAGSYYIEEMTRQLVGLVD